MHAQTIKVMGLFLLLGACSQTRQGIGGRYENAYLLTPVEICSNLSGTARGCFELEVNLNDNLAYLDVLGLTETVANSKVRVLARRPGGNFEVVHSGFKPVVGSYVEVRSKSGAHITQYNEWYIETSTVANSGTGLVPQEAAVGAGTPVVHSLVEFSDLEDVLAASGMRLPY